MLVKLISELILISYAPIFFILLLPIFQTFYKWTQEAASSVTNKIIESDSAVPEVKVCTAALDLMLQILNWDFCSNLSDKKINVNVFSAGVRQDGDSFKRSECHLVQVISWFAD